VTENPLTMSPPVGSAVWQPDETQHTGLFEDAWIRKKSRLWLEYFGGLSELMGKEARTIAGKK
jgi:hypothetical protein